MSSVTIRVPPRFVALLAVVAATALIGCGGSDSSSSGSAKSANAIDRAFVQEMIPHHEMAVEMAKPAEKSGRHAEIKSLAASISSSQRDQIAEMQTVAQTLGVKPDKMPMGGAMTQSMGAMDRNATKLGIAMDQMGMMMDMSSLDHAKPFDRKFIDLMIPHHAGAIRMARAELAKGANPKLRRLANEIIAAQVKEIRKMNSWRTRWFGQPSPAGGVPKS